MVSSQVVLTKPEQSQSFRLTESFPLVTLALFGENAVWCLVRFQTHHLRWHYQTHHPELIEFTLQFACQGATFNSTHNLSNSRAALAAPQFPAHSASENRERWSRCGFHTAWLICDRGVTNDQTFSLIKIPDESLWAFPPKLQENWDGTGLFWFFFFFFKKKKSQHDVTHESKPSLDTSVCVWVNPKTMNK